MTLFRDLSSEGWPSMDRYADELEAALHRLGCDVQSFAPALPWRRLPGRLKTAANYGWRTLVYPKAAQTRQGEVNHILDHTYGHLIGALDPRRTVVTCHDVAPLAFGSPGRGVAGRLWRRSFWAMLVAARIIVASAFTRGELLRRAPYPAERLVVVAYGVGQEFRSAAPQATLDNLRTRFAPGGRPLILHVGSCHPRKNVEAILRALPALRDLNPRFVQIGGRFGPVQRDLIASLGIAGHVAQSGRVHQADLPTWYRAANLLVFPSLYEGFGLPVLEAMACGTPVACANAASLPEVAGGAAALFDPGDPGSLAATVRSILTDAGRRRQLSEAGLARSAGFSWDEAARQTWEVYREVAADARASS